MVKVSLKTAAFPACVTAACLVALVAIVATPFFLLDPTATALDGGTFSDEALAGVPSGMRPLASALLAVGEAVTAAPLCASGGYATLTSRGRHVWYNGTTGGGAVPAAHCGADVAEDATTALDAAAAPALLLRAIGGACAAASTTLPWHDAATAATAADLCSAAVDTSSGASLRMVHLGAGTAATVCLLHTVPPNSSNAAAAWPTHVAACPGTTDIEAAVGSDSTYPMAKVGPYAALMLAVAGVLLAAATMAAFFSARCVAVPAPLPPADGDWALRDLHTVHLMQQAHAKSLRASRITNIQNAAVVLVSLESFAADLDAGPEIAFETARQFREVIVAMTGGVGASGPLLRHVADAVVIAWGVGSWGDLHAAKEALSFLEQLPTAMQRRGGGALSVAAAGDLGPVTAADDELLGGPCFDRLVALHQYQRALGVPFVASKVLLEGMDSQPEWAVPLDMVAIDSTLWIFELRPRFPPASNAALKRPRTEILRALVEKDFAAAVRIFDTPGDAAALTDDHSVRLRRRCEWLRDQDDRTRDPSRRFLAWLAVESDYSQATTVQSAAEPPVAYNDKSVEVIMDDTHGTPRTFKCGKQEWFCSSNTRQRDQCIYANAINSDGLPVVIECREDTQTEQHRVALCDAVYAKRITHVGRLAVYGICRFNRRYLVTIREFVDGESLANFVRQHSPLPHGPACRILRQVLDVLHHVHKQGLCHRAIALESVQMAIDARCRLTNFGHAVPLPTDARGTVEVDPLPSWVPANIHKAQAPELRRTPCRVHATSDIYSLGILAAGLFFPPQPFDHSTDFVRLGRDAQLPPERVAIVDQFLKRCLAEDPKDRSDCAQLHFAPLFESFDYFV